MSLQIGGRFDHSKIEPFPDWPPDGRSSTPRRQAVSFQNPNGYANVLKKRWHVSATTQAVQGFRGYTGKLLLCMRSGGLYLVYKYNSNKIRLGPYQNKPHNRGPET